MNKTMFFNNLTQIGGIDPNSFFLAAKENEENAVKILMRFFSEIFSKPYNETLADLAEQKNQICHLFFQTTKCPFEKITTKNWQRFFLTNFSEDPDGKRSKNIFLFGHVFTNNQWHLAEQIWKTKELSLVFNFDYFENSFVEIDGVKYVYGEKTITVQQNAQPEEDYELIVHMPTIVLDPRMIEPITSHPGTKKVIEHLYILFSLTSDYGLIRNFFQEEDLICDGTKTGLTGIADDLEHEVFINKNLYDVNFKRLMRMIGSTPEFQNKVLESLNEIKRLTQHWKPTVQEYVVAIASERASLILKKGIFEPDTHNRFLELQTQDGLIEYLVQDSRIQMTQIGGSEGIIYSTQKEQILYEFTFAEMASIVTSKVMALETATQEEIIEG